MIFEKDINGDPLYKYLSKSQAQDLLKSLNEDVIPLYKENDYEQGLKKAKKIQKLLLKNLEK